VQGLLVQPIACLIGRQPLKQLSQLSDLSDKGQQYRLGVLELLPIPL
jgi:hypothetical protein